MGSTQRTFTVHDNGTYSLQKQRIYHGIELEPNRELDSPNYLKVVISSSVSESFQRQLQHPSGLSNRKENEMSINIKDYIGGYTGQPKKKQKVIKNFDIRRWK